MSSEQSLGRREREEAKGRWRGAGLKPYGQNAVGRPAVIRQVVPIQER
jgi:hypothetical protein